MVVVMPAPGAVHVRRRCGGHGDAQRLAAHRRGGRGARGGVVMAAARATGMRMGVAMVVSVDMLVPVIMSVSATMPMPVRMPLRRLRPVRAALRVEARLRLGDDQV